MKVDRQNKGAEAQHLEELERRLLGRAHFPEVMKALSESCTGLSFSEILYDIVRNPKGTSDLLKDMHIVGWVEHEKGGLYFITKKGLETYERLRGIVL